MGVLLTRAESSELYRLLAEDTGDIVFKLDRDGFLVEASPAIAGLGVNLPELLIGPHIADLVDPMRAGDLREIHRRVMGGLRVRGWTEFMVRMPSGQQRWFELSLRALSGPGLPAYGALGLLRDIDERKRHEQELFAAEMTDPLTGLTNRRAFMTMLEHLIECDMPGSMVLLDIDHFRAINMKHGHSVGDEVLLLFADSVRRLARSSDIVSRVGGEALGILMPGTSLAQAEANCQRIVSAVGELRQDVAGTRIAITASAGVSRIVGTLDATIQRAEMALFLAKAKGRNRLESDCGSRLAWTGERQVGHARGSC
jgi:diguanylate cyclase (GGDEF)-like protein/PAS domain S-box-containing protein